MLLLILKSLWFFLPIGAANMTPVISKGILKKWAVPIHEKWFGKNKTVRGLVLGILGGEIVYLLQYFINSDYLSLFNYHEFPIWVGFVLGFGALFGDLVESFIKRRLKFKPGATFFPFDQTDYTIMGLLLGSIIFSISWQIWVGVILIGIVLHILTNNIAYLLKLKDTRW